MQAILSFGAALIITLTGRKQVQICWTKNVIVSLSITALSYRNACTARPSCDSCHMQGHHKRDKSALVLNGFTNKLSQCISTMEQLFALGKQHSRHKTSVS
jgi:hypothetical protein